MKHLTAFLVGFVLIMGCARPDTVPVIPTSVPVDTSDYRTFYPPNTNYTIKIPAGWSTSTNPSDPEDTVAEFWPDQSARVYVSYQPELPGLNPSPEQLTEQIVVAVRNEYPDAEFHEAGRIALANGDAARLTFSTSALGASRGTIYTFSKYSFIYQVALIADETVWEKYLPEAEAMAASLTIA